MFKSAGRRNECTCVYSIKLGLLMWICEFVNCVHEYGYLDTYYNKWEHLNAQTYPWQLDLIVFYIFLKKTFTNCKKDNYSYLHFQTIKCFCLKNSGSEEMPHTWKSNSRREDLQWNVVCTKSRRTNVARIKK